MGQNYLYKNADPIPPFFKKMIGIQKHSICIRKLYALKLFKIKKPLKGKFHESICGNYLSLLLTFLHIMTNVKASMGKILWVD